MKGIVLLLCWLFSLAHCDILKAVGKGLRLDDVVLGQSAHKDYRGQPYLFFVFKPEVDQVSGTMLQNGGQWEPELNQLFLSVWMDDGNKTGVTVLDVGANVGAFSLYVASLGCCRLFSFEMQEFVYTLLEMSRRINGYRKMRLFNAALWGKSGMTVSYNPVRGNYGMTSMRQDAAGKVNTTTKRIDDLYKGDSVFFMKVDCEGSEEQALMGVDDLFRKGAIRHFVMETRSHQSHMVENFYKLGYKCGLYDRILWPESEAADNIRNMQKYPEFAAKSGYIDIYCTNKK